MIDTARSEWRRGTYVVSERLFHAGDVREHVIQRRHVHDQRLLIRLRYVYVYNDNDNSSNYNNNNYCYYQGSYRSSVVKFPDFSSHGMTISLTLSIRNSNPITQMLEMVHYILRFIITMKRVIYGAILSAGREPGECCKLLQWGLGRSRSGNQIWCI